MGVLALLWSRPVLGYSQPCVGETGESGVTEALARIRSSVDPCGESPQVVALLDKLEHCTATNYQICTSQESDRNWFDRPGRDPAFMRTITWNPTLLTAIELGCDGDPSKPVLRDATASLLHELAHAAQDCDGLDPAAHELEAVRIENIYRRAAGMCQRRGYGDESLPIERVRLCEPGHCSCAPRGGARFGGGGRASQKHTPGGRRARSARGVDAVTSADAQPTVLVP